MRVIGVRIVLEQEDGGEVVCERDRGYLWSISGPVYPRVLKLLDWISDWCRDFDKAGHERVVSRESALEKLDRQATERARQAQQP